MITEVSDIHLRQNLRTLLSQVEDRKDSILISKDGKPVAALVDADLFARINRIRDRFDDLANRIAEDYAQTPLKLVLRRWTPLWLRNVLNNASRPRHQRS